jgi:hypothetical protein
MTGQPCSPDRSRATNGRPRARLVRLDGAASFAHRPYCSRHHCCSQYHRERAEPAGDLSIHSTEPRPVFARMWRGENPSAGAHAPAPLARPGARRLPVQDPICGRPRKVRRYSAVKRHTDHLLEHITFATGQSSWAALRFGGDIKRALPAVVRFSQAPLGQFVSFQHAYG